MSPSNISRRQFMRGASFGGVALGLGGAGLLSGCGSSSGGGSGSGSGPIKVGVCSPT